MGKNKRKQKQKLEIVFNSKSRREFLTGFQKRKNERKKRAKDELEELLKIERKRIRLEVKDSVKHLKKSFEPIPEVQHLLDEEEYEDEDVTVKIVDLSAENVASKFNFIGENKPNYQDDTEVTNEAEQSSDEDDGGIQGMGTARKGPPANKPAAKIDPNKITSKKDLNRLTKKTAIQSVRRNKLFKMKSKLDSVANRKKAHKEKRRQSKLQAKQQKHKRNFKKR